MPLMVLMSRCRKTHFGTCLGNAFVAKYAGLLLSRNERSVHLENSSKITRRNVAGRLGVSVSTVRRMEGVELHPEQDERGIWWFDKGEVEYVAAHRKPRRAKRPNSDSGQVAGRIFDAFEAGKGLNEIVTELRVHPSVVRQFYSQWSIDLETGELARRHEQRCAEERREQREYEKLLRPKR